MKRFFIFNLFYIILFTNFNIAYSISPDVFIQSTVNRASQALSENISKEEKINKLKMIAKETVDIRGVGFYSLGSARKNLNDEQKVTYSNLFEYYFLKSFSPFSKDALAKSNEIGSIISSLGASPDTISPDSGTSIL